MTLILDLKILYNFFNWKLTGDDVIHGNCDFEKPEKETYQVIRKYTGRPIRSFINSFSALPCSFTTFVTPCIIYVLILSLTRMVPISYRCTRVRLYRHDKINLDEKNIVPKVEQSSAVLKGVCALSLRVQISV